MATKKTLKTTKKATTVKRKVSKISKADAVSKYLKHKKEEYPSFEDFQIWCLNKKIMSIKETEKREYKGLIYIYSKRYLTNKIASGERRANSMVIMLRELEEHQRQQEKNEVKQAPVKIVIDFEKSEKGKHERTKIKSKTINS